MKCRLLAIAPAVFVALVAIPVAPASAQTSHLFYDNFARTTGLGPSWQVSYGGFTTDGTSAISATPPTNGNWARALPSQDYSVSANIVLPSGSMNSGLVARSKDPVNFDGDLYAAKISTDGSLNLYRRNSWSWTLLQGVAAGIAPNTSYALKLVVAGTNPVHLEVWLNGAKLISVDDASASRIPQGVAGIVAYASGVQFTNFEIDSGASRVFFDAFGRTSGLGSNWSVAYGAFTTNGAGAVSGTPPANGDWARVVPDFGTNDYSISAALIIPPGSSNTGLVARSTDPQNFDANLYSAQIGTDGTVSLYRRNAWTWTLLQSVAAGIVANTSYPVQLRVTGGNPSVHLEVWLNGVRRISFDDSSTSRLTSGSCGMENYVANAKYASFTIDPAGSSPILSVSVTGSGSVTSPVGINCPSGACSAAVPAGTTVTLTPQAAAGYVFSSWGGACTGTGACTLTMNASASVSAQFLSRPTTYPVAVSVTAGGSVSSSPAGIACPGACGTNVAPGTTMMLTARAASGYSFSGWGGACNGTTPTCTVAVNGSTSVSAAFAVTTTYLVSVAITGSGAVTSSPAGIACPGDACSMRVSTGTTVILTAQPAAGYAFIGWGGGLCSGTGACTLQVVGDDSVSAAFQTYACGNHACARGEFPPASWRPYSSSSAFNIKVPPNPTLMSNSAAIVSRILGDISRVKQPANLSVASDGSGGWPTYWSTAADVWDGFSCTWGACDLMANGMHAYVPAGAAVQDNDLTSADDDRHMTIMDQTTNREFDLWHVNCPAGVQCTCPTPTSCTSPVPRSSTTIETDWSGYTGIYGDGRAAGNGQGNDARIGNLAGRVRFEELRYAIDHDGDDTQNFINHALTITMGCVAGTPVFPADPVHQGTKVCPNAINAPAMGARLWLNMSLSEIDVLDIPAWKKVFLRTLVKYGAIINDTDTSGFYFSWQREAGNQYTSMGVADPWLAFAKSETGIDPSTGQTYSTCWSGDPSTDFGVDCSGPNGAFSGYFGSWKNSLKAGNSSSDGGLDWDQKVWSRLQVLDPCVSQGTC